MDSTAASTDSLQAAGYTTPTPTTSSTSITTTSLSSSTSVSEEDSQAAMGNLEEYETQLLGFTPKSFVSGIYNAVNEYFMQALDLTEECLQKTYSKSGVMTASEIANGMTAIRKLLVPQIDKAFDTLEMFLNSNVLHVPKNVVLPEDDRQMNKTFTTQSYQERYLQALQWRKKIYAVKLANGVLMEYCKTMSRLQGMFDCVLAYLKDVRGSVPLERIDEIRDCLSHVGSDVMTNLQVIRDIQQLEWDPPAKKNRIYFRPNTYSIL